MKLITNFNGSFCLSNNETTSRYQGLFFWIDNEMFRILANADGFFAKKKNVFQIDYDKPFDLLLDCKKNYDNREWGRSYDIVQTDPLVIKFSKRDDVREVNSGEYDLFVAIQTNNFKKVDKWVLQKYSDDEKRNSPPFERWVYHVGVVDGNAKIAAAKKGDEAISLLKFECNKQKVPKTVYESAVHSLKSLMIDEGLFAGLPWFHQRWLRDEVISCKALMQVGEVDHAKKILFYWLSKMDDFGVFPGTLTNSVADGTWVFHRLKELKLSKSEKDFVKTKLKIFVDSLRNKDLIVSGSGESWMDSTYGGDTREGACIEVNALACSACEFSESFGIQTPLNRLKENIRKAFWNGKFIDDVAGKTVARPNVFIAYYVYPELFSPQQWRKCFDYLIPKLWLDWGGFASIDKSQDLFCNEHSGEDPRSYHRGDSWFWINNLAAIVLSNFRKYSKYVNAIKSASSKEILKMGAIGHHAEVSSAKKLSSQGCCAQAWSDALFIELHNL